jgi:hypothetical protein
MLRSGVVPLSISTAMVLTTLPTVCACGIRAASYHSPKHEFGELTFSTDPSQDPLPLYGTVHTAQGEFTGLIQWNREECLTSDILYGVSVDGSGQDGIRFSEIRAIVRRSRDSTVATLHDGRELTLSGKVERTISGTRVLPAADRGIYVDDQRYGRVLISWETFERVDFSENGTGPSYGEFTAGKPLTGTVTTTSGRRIAGRLVYDLDESESTETLDAVSRGINYSIPFTLIASIVLTTAESRTQPVRLILKSGEELLFAPAGDLSGRNGGMLIFVDGAAAEYVKWSEVGKIEFF